MSACIEQNCLQNDLNKNHSSFSKQLPISKAAHKVSILKRKGSTVQLMFTA